MLGRNLDDIPADDVQARKPPQQGESLARCQSTHLRRACARRERRIQAVDVKGDLDGALPYHGTRLRD